LRGFKGAFTQAVKGIAYLRSAGVPFQINTTISRQNYDQIQDIIGLSQHWGAQSLHLFFLIPIGCAKDIFRQQEITAQEYEKVLNYVTEYSKKNSFYIRPICAPFYFGGFKKERVSSHAADKGCLAARQMLFISSQGKVFPCGYLPLSAGDLREDSLESIWRKGKIFVTLRKQKPKGKCASCRFQADCGGGCRARAYALSQDYLAEDPLCIYSVA
jgi:radical SAM protein with 4Fe4S-binding SPASM domain